MFRGVLVCIGLLVFVGTPGFGAESRHIIHSPSAAVLPAWGFGLDVTGRQFLHGSNSGPAINAVSKPAEKPEMALNYGLFGRAEIGVRWNSGDTGFKAVSGQWKALMLEEKGLIPSFAIGMLGITSEKYPFPDSMPPAESWTVGHPENNSGYAVLGKGIPELGRLYLGIGSGKFAGRGTNTRVLHGAFGGLHLNVLEPVWMAGEIDGRSINGAIGVSMDATDSLSFTASLRGEFMENLRQSSRDTGLRPAIGGTLELVYAPFTKNRVSTAEEKPATAPVILAPAPAVSATAVNQSGSPLGGAPVRAKVSPAQAGTATPISPAVASKPVVHRKVAPKPIAGPATSPAPTAPKTGTGK